MTVVSRRPALHRRAVVLAVLGVAILAAGCSSDGVEPARLSPSRTSSPSITATAAPVKEDAAVLDAYHRYWAANVESQRGNDDPKLFDGNTTGPLVEEKVIAAQGFKKNGVVREGNPTFTKVTVVLDGDDANIRACVDSTNWFVAGAKGGPPPGKYPAGTVLKRIDGSWLVTETFIPGSEFAC